MQAAIMRDSTARGPLAVLHRLALAALLVLAAVSGRAAELDFPALSGRVVDEAGVLDQSTLGTLTTTLADLEASTTDQFVVVTLHSLRGVTIEEYGVALGRHWRIGQAGRNNGVLLIVAPHERKVRIEVGYGLEGQLPDAVTKIVIENTILPRFRANDYAGGIRDGADRIVELLTHQTGEMPSSRESGWSGQPSPDAGPDWITGVVEAVFWGIIYLVFAVMFGTLALFVLYIPVRLAVVGAIAMGWLPRCGDGKRAAWLEFLDPAPSTSSRSHSTSGSHWSSSSDSSWSSSSSSSDSSSSGGGDFGGGGSSGSW